MARDVLAADYLLQALSADPTHAGARNKLGFALRTLGQTVEAAEQFRTTLKLRPTFNHAQRALNEIARKG